MTAIHELPPEFVVAQLDAVFSDLGVDAAKTGMLFSRRVIETVAGFLEAHPVPLVVDPVMVASSGAKLLEDDAVDALVARLFPLATVVTPNLPEARARSAGDGHAARARRAAARARRAGGDRHRRPRRAAVDHLFDGRDARRDPGRAARDRGDARRRLHALGDARRAARPRPAARGGGARRGACGSEAVRHGLAELGAGDGPVDVLNLKGSMR